VTFVLVVVGQFGAEAIGLDADDRVLGGVEGSTPLQRIDTDAILLEILVGLKGLRNDESQEVLEGPRPGESLAIHHSV